MFRGLRFVSQAPSSGSPHPPNALSPGAQGLCLALTASGRVPAPRVFLDPAQRLFRHCSRESACSVPASDGVGGLSVTMLPALDFGQVASPRSHRRLHGEPFRAPHLAAGKARQVAPAVVDAGTSALHVGDGSRFCSDCGLGPEPVRAELAEWRPGGRGQVPSGLDTRGLGVDVAMPGGDLRTFPRHPVRRFSNHRCRCRTWKLDPCPFRTFRASSCSRYRARHSGPVVAFNDVPGLAR